MNSTCTTLEEGILLSYHSILLAVILLLLIGGLLGYSICKYVGVRQSTSCVHGDKRGIEGHSLPYSRTINRSSSASSNQIPHDRPIEVLMGSLDLLSSLWESDMSASKVVHYLSPGQMHQMLFTGPNSLCLNEEGTLQNGKMNGNGRTSPRSSAIDISKSELNNNRNLLVKADQSSSNFLQLLSSLQKYSVNTSHPYFFNQLFGSLDPIALAAEIVALSVNTSVYTYETAPVFTLLEREVMRNIGNLVFGEGDDEFEGEGLMIPGGSLANLTAMHAARHRWKVRNGFVKSKEENCRKCCWVEGVLEEEKKLDDSSITSDDTNLQYGDAPETSFDDDEEPALVAFVSSEAHYSFSKSARVLGIRDKDLIVIPTHDDGRMDVSALANRIEELERGIESNTQSKKRVPFFVACTSGSTVRGSFDDIASIVQVCREYESRGSTCMKSNAPNYQRTIWVHVDGAWGGSAIFSSRQSVRSVTHMDEVRYADSFTFNPHKMLGAPQQTTAFIVRHRNALKNANAAGAKYLFDPRKNGAEYDLGDLSYTCGRRTDAVKLWAMWKYYGKEGLGDRVDQKVDELQLFVEELRRRPSFALACTPWLFNVNFFYFPPRIREMLRNRGIQSSDTTADDHSFIQIPDDIAEDLANVSVNLKLRLHEAGEMIIPYQVRFIVARYLQLFFHFSHC